MATQVIPLENLKSLLSKLQIFPALTLRRIYQDLNKLEIDSKVTQFGVQSTITQLLLSLKPDEAKGKFLHSVTTVGIA